MRTSGTTTVSWLDDWHAQFTAARRRGLTTLITFGRPGHVWPLSHLGCLGLLLAGLRCHFGRLVPGHLQPPCHLGRLAHLWVSRPATLAALALATFGRTATLAVLATFGGRFLARSLVCIVVNGGKRYTAYTAYCLLSHEFRLTMNDK